MGRQMQKLQTLYYGLVAVPLVLFLVFYLQASQPQFQPALADNDVLWMHILVWLVVLILAGLAVKAYYQRIKAYSGPGILDQKFSNYIRESRRLYLVLIPLLLLPVIAIWATGVMFYSALFSLMIILVAALRPTVEQFIQRYRLSKEEQEELVRLT